MKAFQAPFIAVGARPLAGRGIGCFFLWSLIGESQAIFAFVKTNVTLLVIRSRLLFKSYLILFAFISSSTYRPLISFVIPWFRHLAHRGFLPHGSDISHTPALYCLLFFLIFFVPRLHIDGSTRPPTGHIFLLPWSGGWHRLYPVSSRKNSAKIACGFGRVGGWSLIAVYARVPSWGVWHGLLFLLVFC